MKLNEVVPWGRSLFEYQLMFNLSNADLSSKILGCGDGPASFNAEMTSNGYTVVSIDPLYQYNAEQIRQRVEDTYDNIISQLKQNPHDYCWKNFRDADEVGEARLKAMERFLLDYQSVESKSRYLNQSLPKLEFSDNQFDLCLCSHLLFLYSDRLSFDFHLQSIQELLRVATQVRIFPLLTLDCKLSPYINPITEKLSSQGINIEIETVDYEFQKGGNQMMKLNR